MPASRAPEGAFALRGALLAASMGAACVAAVTFGASLAQIPIFKTITGIIVDQLIGMAIEMVLNGGN